MLEMTHNIKRIHVLMLILYSLIYFRSVWYLILDINNNPYDYNYFVLLILLTFLWFYMFILWSSVYLVDIRSWFKYCNDMMVFRNGIHAPNTKYLSFKKKLDILITKNENDKNAMSINYKYSLVPSMISDDE